MIRFPLIPNILKKVLPALFLFFTAELFSQSYNAEVINEETSFIVKGSVLNTSYSVAIKINNSQGDNYAIVNIPYSEDSPISNLEAWIEDVNGKKIRELKSKEIADKSNIHMGTFYDDNRVKVFELKNNTYPYVIKYQYSYKKKDFILICWWSPIYRDDIPTHESKLIVDIPVGYKVSLYQDKIAPPVTDSIKGRIIMTWQATYMQPIKPEIYSPSIEELAPHVYMVPLKFNEGIPGTQQDWASFGNWYYNLTKGLDELPPSEVQKVHELITGISDKKLIVKRLYEYLQDNTRYVGIQIGISGYKCFPADYIANKKYGDCKGLANYMKALLKAAGIPSQLALIYAGNGENTHRVLDKFVASQFNHAILFVPLEKDTIWLECTSKTNPTGYLGSFTQNRYALIINENNSKLVKTPALVPSNCYTSCNNNISIDKDENALLKSTTTCTGYGFDFNTAYSTQLNKDKQKEYLNQVIPYQGFELKQLNIKSESRDSASIKLDYQIVLKNNITQSSNSMFLQLSGPKPPKFENPSKRHFPVCLAYPINYIDTTEVTIPDKYKAKNIPDENIETQFGAVTVKYILHDDKIKIYRNILIKSGDYSIEEYPDFYQFITKLQEITNTPISFIKNE